MVSCQLEHLSPLDHPENVEVILASTTRLLLSCSQMEATPNGFQYVPAQANLADPFTSDYASTTIAGGPALMKPERGSSSLVKSEGGSASQSDRGAAPSQWVPSWAQKLERKDVVMGAAVVVAAGAFIVWLNLHRRAAQV